MSELTVSQVIGTILVIAVVVLAIIGIYFFAKYTIFPFFDTPTFKFFLNLL